MEISSRKRYMGREVAMQIAIDRYPQLRHLCWNRPRDAVIGGEEALALYERNWRFVDKDAFTADERWLLDTLVARYGNGILMVA